MHMFDASSTIYGWDNYPLAQFPRLWDWIGSQIGAGLVTLSETAHKEVAFKLPDCGKWLQDQGLTVVVNTPAMLQEASQIKTLLNIVGDNYHADGVGENDLLIIASAKTMGATLVSDEMNGSSLASRPIVGDLRFQQFALILAQKCHAKTFLSTSNPQARVSEDPYTRA